MTLRNVDRFSKFFHQSIRKTMHTRQRFPSHLHYLVKFENSKMFLILAAFTTNCRHVSGTLRALDLFLTAVRRTVDIDTQTFWCLSDDYSRIVSNQHSTLFSWTLLHHGDFSPWLHYFRTVFIQGYTSYGNCPTWRIHVHLSVCLSHLNTL